MFLNGKLIDALTEDDLNALITDGAREDGTRDFKRDAYSLLPNVPADINNKNKKRAELCKDVSGFANAQGGWIVCGMGEEDGVASEVCGLGNIDADAETRRLDQTLKNGIEPPVLGVQIKVVNLQDTTKKTALVIGIPRSMNAPHRVKETQKFHIRRNTLVDDMTIDELRSSFSLRDTLAERIKNFRRERVNAIMSGSQAEVPVPLADGVHVVLHIVPMALDRTLDIYGFSSENLSNYARDSYLDSRFNVDGYLMSGVYSDRGIRNYVQIYRNGTLEILNTFFVSAERQGGKWLRLQTIEDEFLRFASLAKEIESDLGTEMPLVLMASVLRTQDVKLTWNDPFRFPTTLVPLRKDVVLVPDVIMQDANTEIAETLRPVFDVLSNAGGYPNSYSYDQNGQWNR
jgi:hypothetical protein